MCALVDEVVLMSSSGVDSVFRLEIIGEASGILISLETELVGRSERLCERASLRAIVHLLSSYL
jgi:hypothetical protein